MKFIETLASYDDRFFFVLLDKRMQFCSSDSLSDRQGRIGRTRLGNQSPRGGRLWF
ncbi:MAG: hypothetical protein J7647_11660 [Cyanobacteria bacterium SBLK]|nr:hypothetical protein [Cyanobacteria bacterium SBLK]